VAALVCAGFAVSEQYQKTLAPTLKKVFANRMTPSQISALVEAISSRAWYHAASGHDDPVQIPPKYIAYGCPVWQSEEGAQLCCVVAWWDQQEQHPALVVPLQEAVQGSFRGSLPVGSHQKQKETLHPVVNAKNSASMVFHWKRANPIIVPEGRWKGLWVPVSSDLMRMASYAAHRLLYSTSRDLCNKSCAMCWTCWGLCPHPRHPQPAVQHHGATQTSRRTVGT